MEQRWIPVSERLPNEDEFIKSYRRNKYAAEFIVMIKGANRPTTLYFTHDGRWTDNMKDRYDVTAWMPLPEPYRESEEEQRTKNLSDKEIEDFSNLINKVLAEICRISDAHNIDRDSALKYFADMLTAFTEVATIQNYDSKQTNADRIRNMTDEELAVNMMCPNENGLAEIDCDKNDNCNCYECLLKWLRAESEDNMERLTYVAENGKVLFHPADLPDDKGMTITQLAENGRYKDLEEIAERLANREQAEEQGLRLWSPCKVGDKVYIIAGKDISEQKIQRVTIGSNEILEFCTRKRGFAISAIGKKVFLTREEAEAKLKEMEESHG